MFKGGITDWSLGKWILSQRCGAAADAVEVEHNSWLLQKRLKESPSLPSNVTWEITPLNLKRNIFNMSMNLGSLVSVRQLHTWGTSQRQHDHLLKVQWGDPIWSEIKELKPKNVSILIYLHNTRQSHIMPFEINLFSASRSVNTHLWWVFTDRASSQTDYIKEVKGCFSHDSCCKMLVGWKMVFTFSH